MLLQPASHFRTALRFLFTDIDDTLTNDGVLTSIAYESLWKLSENGIKVVPVTGRPAGWCDLIARQWPVEGVIGENGGFFFRYDHRRKKMIRNYAIPQSQVARNQLKLKKVGEKILRQVKGSAVSADQFSRQMDLAIDFCEDIPRLSKPKVLQIQKIFQQAGAQAKISSIHVNGWYGSYNKLSQSLVFLKKEFGISGHQALKVCGYVGDSPNDEPLWQFFPHSFGVANVKKFIPDLKFPPRYVTRNEGGQGFKELAQVIIRNKRL